MKFKNTFFSLILVFVIALYNTTFVAHSSIVPCEIANMDVWDGTIAENVFPNDKGTFEIYTGAELAWIAYKVNSGSTFIGKTIELMNDIDLSDYEWTPIGGLINDGTNNTKYFSGTFYGNNKVIRGLNIGSNLQPRQSSYSGLFGCVSSSGEVLIKDLYLEDIKIFSSSNYVGGLVGDGYNLILNNVHTTGTILGLYCVGGLVGRCTVYYLDRDTITISRSDSKCEVAGKTYVGGLIGSGSIEIVECYATGSVSGVDNVGGLIGNGDDVYGNISKSYATGNVYGNNYVGGLAGNGAHTINNCYALGKVSGVDNVGGLVGYKFRNINNCYAIGSVSGNKYIGGLIGWVRDSCRVSNCYSAGDIYGTQYVGGILGSESYALISNCYWNIDAVQKIGSETLTESNKKGVGNGISDTTHPIKSNEMKNTAFTKILNSNISGREDCMDWVQDENNINCGYPILNMLLNPQLFWISNADEVISENNIYNIYSAEQLAGIAHEVNNGNDFSGKTINLMSDINLTGKYWTPIGTSEINCFKGNFNGNYKVINGLVIGTEVQPKLDSYTGLFGYVSGSSSSNKAIINNVELKNAYIYGRYYTGSLVGYGLNLMISNCGVSGDVTGLENVGGLAGYAYEINNSYAKCNVVGTQYVGGLVGYSPLISNCYSLSNASGTQYVGGLVGYAVTMNNCYAVSNITGTQNLGALIGKLYDSGTILNSYWNEDVIQIEDGFKLTNNLKKGVGYGNDKATRKTTEELKSKIELINWDFSSVWYMAENINNGYSLLKWQINNIIISYENNIITINSSIVINDVLLIAASYKGNRMIDLKMFNLSTSGNITKDLNGLQTLSGDKIKIMLLNNINCLNPITSYEIYNIE